MRGAWLGRRWLSSALLLLGLAAGGCELALPPAERGGSGAATAVERAPAGEAERAEGRGRSGRAAPRGLVDDVEVLNYGRVHYRGTVDLRETIARIQRGERHSHRNDGSVFQNRERRLPAKPRGYYREYVHPTKGLRGPGPQRIVVGEGGDWYYTPDHYESFIPLN